MRITKVLIAYDGSECADAALEDLLRAGLPEKAHAIALSVIENWPLSSGPEAVGSFDYHQETLAMARLACGRIGSLMPGWMIEPLVGFGSPANVIIRKADEWRPDLVVVGSHGRTAAGRLIFGSVSQKLAHEAHCTVRVARKRAREANLPARLVIGVDGSKGAEAAVNAVAERRWPQGSEARVCAALWSPPMATSEQTLVQVAEWVAKEDARVAAAAEAAERRLQDAGLKTSLVIKEEEPKRLLLGEAESWDADAIFVGARGMGRLERFLTGSVSSAVAARAHCSVEIVRASQPPSNRRKED